MSFVLAEICFYVLGISGIWLMPGLAHNSEYFEIVWQLMDIIFKNTQGGQRVINDDIKKFRKIPITFFISRLDLQENN